MLSVETAKAVVEVPSPVSGTITALHAQPGDRIEIGAPLIVGRMPGLADDDATAAALEAANAVTGPRVRAVPAARALARSLGVEVGTLTGSGRGGLITLDDVMAVGLPGSNAASKMHPAPSARAPAVAARMAQPITPHSS